MRVIDAKIILPVGFLLYGDFLFPIWTTNQISSNTKEEKHEGKHFTRTSLTTVVSIPYVRFITAFQRENTQVFLAPAQVLRTFVFTAEPQILVVINYENQTLLSG